jgi:aspartyl-tRNA(Asn)/glutamyl-tRNA(Gln) amidotransferase subunit A
MPRAELQHKSAVELLSLLASRDITAVDLAEAALDQIKQMDPQVKAFLSVTADAAIDTAAKIDQRRAAGQPVGRLAGLPIALKDLLCTTGVATTAGSKMLEHYRPPYDATLVTRLSDADAVCVGKTNMDEFAMGGATENSAYFPTNNPWDLSRSPGGSSGGSAACVAARMVPWSIGSDTGGSIRQPAGLCGIVGFKPSYGRVSRYGMIAFASSLDQLGPFARSVPDVALLLEVIAGHDPLDSTSVVQPVPPYLQTVDTPLAGLRVGVVEEHYSDGLHPEVAAAIRQSIDVYRSLGAEIVPVEMPHARYGVATYYVIAPSEASSNLARYDGIHCGHRADEKQLLADMAADRAAAAKAMQSGSASEMDSALVRLYRRSREEGFGPEVKRRIMLGTYALSAGYYDAYYLQALKVRRLIKQDYDQAFAKCDVILGPVTSQPAFPLGEKSKDPLALYLVDLYTVPANLAGITGISLPCGQATNGLPIGFQLQAPAFAEERLLRAARMFERSTNWHDLCPPLVQPTST